MEEPAHGRDVFPSVQQKAVLAVEIPLPEEELAGEADAFMVDAMSGECKSFMSVVVGEQVS